MTQAEAEAFLFREVRLLDRGRFRDWRQLLADDAVYWVPNGDSDGDPQRHCSIIYATPPMVDDRLERAESPFYWVGDPPIRTVHTVSNVLLERTDGNSADIACNQVIYLYRDNDQRRDQALEILPAQCEYRLQRHAEQWRITYKKVALLSSDGLVPLLPPII
jgi:3-phenylpropionate/cinnamic acid dioxygenase small subunit